MLAMTQSCLKRCVERNDIFTLAECLLECGTMYTDMQNLCGDDANDNSKAAFQMYAMESRHACCSASPGSDLIFAIGSRMLEGNSHTHSRISQQVAQYAGEYCCE